MRKITIEEHCFPEYFLDYMQSRKEYPVLRITTDEKGQKIWWWWNTDDEYYKWLPTPIIKKLVDVGEDRLQDIDKAGIDMQVLSFPFNIDQIDAADGVSLTKKINDGVAASVKKYPDRFAALATLPLKDAPAAADELERTVRQLGFKGAMILPHVGGEFIDAKKYWPVFARAAGLGVPVYIHPMHPPLDRMKQYWGYPQLTASMWGFAAEAGLAAIRLICSGAFDEYPDLKIILGHLGEALPFWMLRLDDRMIAAADSVLTNRDLEAGVDPTPLSKKLKKLPSQYIRDNFFVTTSGMTWFPPLQCTILALGVDKILFAADYPFESSQKTVQSMETVSISDSDKEKIFHLNAERLLGL